MLPPVLEVFVVWHPGDGEGEQVAQVLLDHFHGTVFTGLIGGAVEVYVRSQGWTGAGRPPRSLPLPGTPTVNGVGAPHYVAVVPVLGLALMRQVSHDDAWRTYLGDLADAQARHPARVAVFPLRTATDVDRSVLARLTGRFQAVGTVVDGQDEQAREVWRRNLAQGLAQFVLGPRHRLQVFISHTRKGTDRGSAGEDLTELVRDVIARTRLGAFFDAHDLQSGEDWEPKLITHAGRSALLALRTDLYASRMWCQREVLTAKRQGASMVVLDALEAGEERGSFLMDHVPRVPIRRTGAAWSRRDVEFGLGLLVDEALKRALWNRQEQLAANRPELAVTWWAPHAPEPVTLAAWLREHPDVLDPARTEPVRILHPDPPLGDPELRALQEVASLSGVTMDLDVMTPRQLAARGG